MSEPNVQLIVASRNELIHLNDALTSFESFLAGELDDDDLDDMFAAIQRILTRNHMSIASIYSAKNRYGKLRFHITVRELDLLHKGVIIMAYMGGGDDAELTKQIKNAFGSFKRMLVRNKLTLREPDIQYMESIPDMDRT